MKRTYSILSLLTILVVVLPTILPMLPVAVNKKPLIAKAQSANDAAIYTDVDSLNRLISYGMVFKVYIEDTNAASHGITSVKATVYVAGIANYNVLFTLNTTSGYYEAEFNISRLGTTDNGEVYVRYYNFTTGSWSAWRKLIGTLAEGDTLVIEYLPYNATTPIKAVLTYRLADITIRNRLYGSYYWIPRLTTDIAGHYGAEDEWRLLIPGVSDNEVTVEIKIKDLTTNYEVEKNITFVRETGIVFKPANATEAAKITDLLVNVSSQLASPWWIKGVDYAKPVYRGDEVTVSATIYAPSAAQPITTKTRKLAIFVSDAVIEVSVTSPTKDIVITVYDADENLNAVAKEQSLKPIELLNASYPGGTVIKAFNLTETADASGVFTVKFNLLDNPELWKTVIGPEDNVVDWHFSDLRLDNVAIAKGQFYCDKFGSFKIPYHTASFYIVEKSVAIRYAQRCCPIPKITLHLEDADADTGELVVARGEVAAGSKVFQVPLYLMRNGVPTPIAAYEISVFVNATNGKEYKLFNVTTAEPLTIAFYTVSPGVVEFDFDLTKLNWTAINEMVTSEGYEIYAVVVQVTDYMALASDGTPKPQTLSDQALVQHVQIELERSTIPVAYKRVEGTVPDLDVKPGDAQIVRITIYDNGSNVDCCEVDTIPASKVKLELVKTYKGEVVIDVTGDGRLVIPLYDVTTAGEKGSLRGYCYIEVSNLTETGADTGIFKGEIKIYSVVDGVRYAGCPSPWLHDAKLYVTYVSPSIGSATAEATFKFLDASIQVVGADGQPVSTVVMGTPIRLVIVDPDANLDMHVNESVLVMYTVQGVGVTATGYLWVKQVDAASDVFNGTVTLAAAGLSEDPLYIDMNLIANNTGHMELLTTCTGCFTVTFTYTDETPYDVAGIQMSEQVLPQLVRVEGGPLSWLALLNYQCVQMMQKTASISVTPTLGKVKIEYTINDTTIQNVINSTVGSVWQDVTNKTGIPAVNKTLINIIITDPDQNKFVNIAEEQPFTVWITVEGYPVQIAVSTLNRTFVEVANGTFELNKPISLEELAAALSKQLNTPVTAYQLAGKKIEVTYNDPMASCPPSPLACALAAGLARSYTYAVDVKGQITVVDAVTGKPKPYYQCACPFGGACPTGGDVILVNVTDISLIDYYPADRNTLTGGPFNILVEKLVGVIAANPNPVLFRPIDIMLEKTADGVYIPYIVYNALARLYCFPVTGNNIIVATNGENVTFVYKDPADATGTPVEVTAKIRVGTPPIEIPPNEASNITSTALYKVEGNRFVPVEVVPAGQPAYIQITLQYDNNVMSQVIQKLGGAGNVFVVMYFIKDASGKLVDYGFKPVAVGDKTVGFGFTLPAPGTYTVTVLVALSADNPVPLSSAYTFTITAS